MHIYAKNLSRLRHSINPTQSRRGKNPERLVLIYQHHRRPFSGFEMILVLTNAYKKGSSSVLIRSDTLSYPPFATS